jgi:hypothetical protein
LEINENKASFELREKYHKEMLKFVEKYRFSAYELFQNNHPQLFESKNGAGNWKKKIQSNYSNINKLW